MACHGCNFLQDAVRLWEKAMLFEHVIAVDLVVQVDLQVMSKLAMI